MLEREIRRAVRSELPLGLLMLDLDHFKKFNDTYGHEAGDTVLREAATFLTKNIRAEDIVCRFGGEEFVIMLPTANVDAAKARAERIRSKLRELTLSFIRDSPWEPSRFRSEWHRLPYMERLQKNCSRRRTRPCTRQSMREEIGLRLRHRPQIRQR